MKYAAQKASVELILAKSKMVASESTEDVVGRNAQILITRGRMM